MVKVILLLLLVAQVSIARADNNIKFEAFFEQDGYTHKLNVKFDGTDHVVVSANSNIHFTSRAKVHLGEWSISYSERLRFFKKYFAQMIEREGRKLEVGLEPFRKHRAPHSMRIVLNTYEFRESEIVQIDEFLEAIADAEVKAVITGKELTFSTGKVGVRVFTKSKMNSHSQSPLKSICQLRGEQYFCRFQEGLIIQKK